MRVLMLTQSYPPVPGGIEQHVRSLSTALAARGHRVSVVTLASGTPNDDMPAFEEIAGVRIFRVRGTIHRLSNLLYSNPDRIYAPPFPDPELIGELRRILREEKPDVVHAHNWMDYSFLPIKQWSGAALVITLHSYNQVCARWNLLYRGERCSGPALSKCLDCSLHEYGAAKGAITYFGSQVMNSVERRAADMYIAVSSKVAERNQLPARHLPHQVIHNFIPDAEEPTVDLPAPLPEGDFILYVGALARSKGINVLLDAYRKLGAERDDIPPLVMIGYDVADDAAALDRLPANVTVLKNWQHAAVLQAWRRCQFGIVPSVWDEPCPTVVLEGMLCGRAMIGTRVGGIPDLIAEGETGLLVPPGDGDALAASIRQLLDHPDQREQMGRAGKLRVRQFQAGTIVPMIEGVYREVAPQGMAQPS